MYAVNQGEESPNHYSSLLLLLLVSRNSVLARITNFRLSLLARYFTHSLLPTIILIETHLPRIVCSTCA